MLNTGAYVFYVYNQTTNRSMGISGGFSPATGGFRFVSLRKGREVTESVAIVQATTLTAFDHWNPGVNGGKEEQHGTRQPAPAAKRDAQISIDSQVGIHGVPTIFISDGVYAFNQGQWRPPRPWASPDIGTGSASGNGFGWNYNAVTNAATIGPWELHWVEDSSFAPLLTNPGRRPRRPGIWQYVSEDRTKYLASSVGVSRPNENKWSAYVRPFRPQTMPRSLCITSGGPVNIQPDAITATSNMSASVGRLRRVTPASISASSAVTATIVGRRAIITAAINATSALVASVVGRKAVRPAAITATSLVSAAIAGRRAIHAAAINATSFIRALFSPFTDRTFAGPGNGGEIFAVRLAPNGTVETATLAVNIGATDTLLELTGDGSLPTSNPFVVTIDDEVLYVAQITLGSYRVRGRGLSNTTPAAHVAGATVTWGESYDMAVAVTDVIAASFTADINSTGSFTYPGSLLCTDVTQAYLGGSRYPMHVTEVLGVFDAGAGSTGSNRCDASQPDVICTPAGVSDDCPVAMANPAFVTSHVLIGDVALVRYTNPEASALDLGPRYPILKSFFGLERLEPDGSVNNADTDGICVDTTGGEGTFTAAVTGAFNNPSAPGINPASGLPFTTNVPYTSVTMPAADRDFTIASKKGWPIGVLAVRQGNRRIPFWESYDWHNFDFGYTGFGVDALFQQIVINRNGVSGSEPEAALPGSQDITGPDAVWDDGSYRFAVAFLIAIFGTPYLVSGPSIGGTPPTLVGFPPVPGYVPIVDFSSGPSTPHVTLHSAPEVEGGSGGDIGLGAQRFDVQLV